MREVLDPATDVFFACGEGDERATDANRRAFEERVLRRRALVARRPPNSAPGSGSNLPTEWPSADRRTAPTRRRRGLEAIVDAPATLAVLPEVVAAPRDAPEAMIDCGIRRGTDVLVALAQGARAVPVGRPAMWGLAAAGASAVEDVLRRFQDELDNALALCGRSAPADAWPSLVGSLG